MLSIDIGYKHMCAAYTEKFETFDIFLFELEYNKTFQHRLKQLKLNMNKIIKIIGYENINKCIIEEQRQTNIPCWGLMYALGMYFENIKIPYQIQPGSIKYRCFKNCDTRRQKDLSVLKVGEFLDKVNIKYQNQDPKKIIKHKWLPQNVADFLIKHQLDKADDFSDTILILLTQKKDD